MTNLYLQVNKDFFKLGLNPTEMIILAQVMEYGRTTGICYMTNAQFAEMLSISERTVSRTINDLLAAGFIDVKNPGSKKRVLEFNAAGVEAKLRQIVEVKAATTENSEQPRQNVQVNIDNLSKKPRQNDPIKENIKDKIKEKSADETICDCLHPYRGDSLGEGNETPKFSF